MNLEFNDNQNRLPLGALSRGPDVLRPGSSTARYGTAREAFAYTQYPDEKGERWHAFSPADGHEKHLDQMMTALFGPNVETIKAKTAYLKTLYDHDPVTNKHIPVGQVQDFDNWEINFYAAKNNLFGRRGYIGMTEVLMFWSIPSPNGWQMVYSLVTKMNIGDHVRIVVGSNELGPIWKFKQAFWDQFGNLNKLFGTNLEI